MGHALQAVCPVALWDLPARQAVQVARFVKWLYWPAGHCLHVGWPVLSWYWPAAHGTQESWPVAAWNFPAAHSSHVRRVQSPIFVLWQDLPRLQLVQLLTTSRHGGTQHTVTRRASVSSATGNTTCWSSTSAVSGGARPAKEERSFVPARVAARSARRVRCCEGGGVEGWESRMRGGRGWGRVGGSGWWLEETRIPPALRWGARDHTGTRHRASCSGTCAGKKEATAVEHGPLSIWWIPG